MNAVLDINIIFARFRASVLPWNLGSLQFHTRDDGRHAVYCSALNETITFSDLIYFARTWDEVEDDLVATFEKEFRKRQNESIPSNIILGME